MFEAQYVVVIVGALTGAVSFRLHDVDKVTLNSPQPSQRSILVEKTSSAMSRQLILIAIQ
jgi:hypothetical protein